jgi:hypothetical protein
MPHFVYYLSGGDMFIDGVIPLLSEFIFYSKYEIFITKVKKAPYEIIGVNAPIRYRGLCGCVVWFIGGRSKIVRLHDSGADLSRIFVQDDQNKTLGLC